MSHTHPAGLLQHLPIPNKVWEDISMDFICWPPLSKGFSVIFVVIDKLSRYGHFLPLKQDFSGQSVAQVFITHILKLHGIPRSIINDRDKTFTSKFWQTLFTRMGTSLALSSAYHPETDGQTENLNKAAEHYLRCFISHNPKAWVDLLPWAEFSYNISFHTSLGTTPFQAVYGREPPPIIPSQCPYVDPISITELLQHRDQLLAQLKLNLKKAQDRMKHYADHHRIEIQYKVGDWLLVKLQPYRQNSVFLKKNHKLGM